MAGGRPTKYNKALSEEICSRIAQGESMRSISRDESMPACETLFRWLRIHEEFQEQYRTAKEESHHAWYEDIVDISDNQVGVQAMTKGEGGEMIPLFNPDGSPVMIVDSPAVAHAKLRVDSRKWALSKLMPKKYGERIHTEHSGNLGLTDLTEDELERKLAEVEQAHKQSLNE